MNRIKDAFDAFFVKAELDDIIDRKPHLCPKIIELALEKYYKNEKTNFMNENRKFGLLRRFMMNDVSSLRVYMNPKFNISFNFYLTSSDSTYRHTEKLYDGSECTFKMAYYSPLMYAVILNKVDLVKAMVEASFASTSKLELDMPHGDMPFVNARSIARKFFNPRERIAMLALLKIDKTRHDLTRVNRYLKNELDITVKEAVMADSVRMLESALFLGNFGDKTDPHIIRRAMLNQNYLILEMLVMEDYAIPAVKDRPQVTTMDKDDVDFILSRTTERRPLNKRYRGIYENYNDHAV